VRWACSELDILDAVVRCPAAITDVLASGQSYLSFPPGTLPVGRYHFSAVVGVSAAGHRMVVSSGFVETGRVLPTKRRVRVGDELDVYAEAIARRAYGMWILVDATDLEWTGEASQDSIDIPEDRVRATSSIFFNFGVISASFPGRHITEPGATYIPVLLVGTSRTDMLALQTRVAQTLSQSGRKSRMPVTLTGAWLLPAPRGAVVNRVPQGGVVAITPEFGQALTTGFHIATMGWQDEYMNDLRFEFYVVLNGNGRFSGSNISIAEVQRVGERMMPASPVVMVDSWLAPEGVHDVVVIATDDMNDQAAAAATVTVSEIDSAGSIGNVDLALRKAEGTNNGFMILSAVKAATTNNKLLGESLVPITNALHTAVRITMPCEEVAAAVGAASAVVVENEAGDADIFQESLLLVSNLVSRVQEASVSLSKNPTASLFKALGTLGRRAQAVRESTFSRLAQASTLQLSRHVTSTLLVDPGETQVFATDDLRVRLHRTSPGFSGDVVSFGRLVFVWGGRRLSDDGCKLDIVETSWSDSADPQRLWRGTIIGPATTFEFFCGGRATTLAASGIHGNASVTLSAPADGVTNTNFRYECVLLSETDPSQYRVLAHHFATPGLVTCPLPADVTSATVATRVLLLGPTVESYQESRPPPAVDDPLAPMMLPVVPIEESAETAAFDATMPTVVSACILLAVPLIFLLYNWQVKRLNRLSEKLGNGLDMVVDESSRLVLTPAQALALAGYDRTALTDGSPSPPGSPKDKPLPELPATEPSSSGREPQAVCDQSEDEDWILEGVVGDDRDVAMPFEMVDPETHISYRAPPPPQSPSPPPLPALDQDCHSDGPLDDSDADAADAGRGEASEDLPQADQDVDWYDADIGLEAVDSQGSAAGSDGPRPTLPVARTRGTRGRGQAQAPTELAVVATDDDATSSLSL